MLIRTIDRYIIMTFVKLFLLAMVALMLMLVTIDMLMQMDEFTEAFESVKDYTTWDMLRDTARYYFFHLPVYVTFIGGVIIVAAAAFTIGWMNHTNELTAMLASGMSLHRVVLPIIIGSMVVGLLIIVDQEVVIPAVRSELITDRDEAGKTERETMQLNWLVDDARSAWYAPEFSPGNEEKGKSAELKMPMVILRDSKFRYAAHIVGEKAYPLFDPSRNHDFEGKIGWQLRPAWLACYGSFTQPQWQQTQKTSTIYTLCGPERFFATARKDNPSLQMPVDGMEIQRPTPQFDANYNMRIRAYKFIPGPAKEGVDARTGRKSLKVIEGELIRPRFDFFGEDDVLLATIFADRAVWVDDDVESKRHWKLEDGACFYPTQLGPEDMELQISGSYLEYLSSGELTAILMNRSTVDRSSVIVTKYLRFVEPLNNLVLLLLVLPFILSRERNLKYSAMLGVLIGAAFFIFIYICRYMDMGEFLSAFLPVLLFGPVSILMLDSVKT